MDLLLTEQVNLLVRHTYGALRYMQTHYEYGGKMIQYLTKKKKKPTTITLKGRIALNGI